MPSRSLHNKVQQHTFSTKGCLPNADQPPHPSTHVIKSLVLLDSTSNVSLGSPFPSAWNTVSSTNQSSYSPLISSLLAGVGSSSVLSTMASIAAMIAFHTCWKRPGYRAGWSVPTMLPNSLSMTLETPRTWFVGLMMTKG